MLALGDSTENMKKILSKSPYNIEAQNVPESVLPTKEKSDQDYFDFVKKYKLGRRNEEKRTNPHAVKSTNDIQETPKKELRQRLKQKLSLSSAPKYSELKMSSKECVISNKKIPKHFSSNKDIRQLSFVSQFLLIFIEETKVNEREK